MERITLMKGFPHLGGSYLQRMRLRCTIQFALRFSLIHALNGGTDIGGSRTNIDVYAA